MKPIFALLIILLICGNSFAQSKENYRSRNHKLNRNYLKTINSKKHQVAVYTTKNVQEERSNLKRNHQHIESSSSRKLVMKFNKKDIQAKESTKYDYRNQKSTFVKPKGENGKKLLNYLGMILALSLLAVSQ